MIFIEIEDVYGKRRLINAEHISSITDEDGQCTIRFSDDYATVNKTLPEIKGMLIYAAREVLTNG